MSIEFPCSQCNRLLRTGDDTVGRLAQCPECGGQTRVPAPETAVPPPSAAPPGGGSPFVAPGPRPTDITADWKTQQSPSGPGAGPGYPGSALYALKRVSGPAVCLMITAVLGICLLILGIIENIFRLGFVVRGGPVPVIFMGPIGIGLQAIGIIVGIIVFAGAIKMKNLESYTLAMAASIIALIPCTSPCCFLGLPFGIWALVVLSDPVVKTSFRN